jgi:hypothetical protein
MKKSIRTAVFGLIALSCVSVQLLLARAALASPGDDIGATAAGQRFNGCGPYAACYTDWCSLFAKWVWNQHGVQFTNEIDARAITFYWYGQNHGTLVATPQVGDAVIHKFSGVWDGTWADHVELVTQVSGNSISTTGGNEGATNWANSWVDTTFYSNWRSVGSIKAFIRPIVPGGTATIPAMTKLALVKTAAIPGSIEVHQAAAPYTSYTEHSTTGLSAGESSLGSFSMAGDKLVYIKTRNTGSGKVELHLRTAATGYTSGYSTPTWFSATDAGNGVFSLVGSDLVFIKTRNTGTGMVEVHKVSSANDYAGPPVLSTATAISTADAGNGVFQMFGNDLVFIKIRNGGAGKVEIHVMDSACNFCRFTQHQVSLFSSAEDGMGQFSLADVVGNDGIADLVYIKTKGTGSGTVELFAASGTHGYAQLDLATPTAFSPGDASNGWWGLNW